MRCSACCNCLRGGALALAVLTVALAALFGAIPDGQQGWHPNSAAAALEPLPRLNASSLSPQAFFEQHVLQGVPVIIQLGVEDVVLPKPELLVEKLLSHCGTRKLRVLSDRQESVTGELLDPQLPWWQRLVADFLFEATAGIDVNGWVNARRAVSLQELAQGSAARNTAKPFTLLPRLLSSLAWLFDSSVLRSMSALAKLIAQPVYLADMVGSDVCREVLGPLSKKFNSYERHGIRRLQKEVAAWQTLRGMERYNFIPDGFIVDDEFRLFWGGPSSYSYPLHHDLPDGDLVCTMYSGCKDVVLVQSQSRLWLSRLSFPGFTHMRPMTWSNDFFSDRPVGGVQGWRGTMQAGDMLYMPGDVLHHIRNSCNQSVSLCRKPWRASEARDIFNDTLRALNLIGESVSLEQGLTVLLDKWRKRRR